MKAATDISGRIKWLDGCRGFAIICVVLAHTAESYLHSGMYHEYRFFMETLDKIISSFHMQLFFCLSGYAFYIAYLKDRKAKKRNFRLRIPDLMIIYLYMSCALWLTKRVMSSSVNYKVTVRDLLMLPVKPTVGMPYWYLYVLVFLYIIMYAVCGSKCDRRILSVIFAAAGAAGSLIGTDTLFYANRVLYYSLFFFLGIILAEGGRKKAVCVLVLTALILSLILAAAFDASVTGTPAIGLVISCAVIPAFGNIKFLGESKLLDFCGRYSMEIYLLHTFITSGNRIILPWLGITYFPLAFGLTALMGVLIPICCGALLKKLRLHKLFFRPATFFSDLRAGKRAGKAQNT